MEKRVIDLNIDYLGGLGIPTVEEEKLIRAFFKAQKDKRQKRVTKKGASSQRSKIS